MEDEFFADFQDFFGDFGKQASRSQKGQDIYVAMDIDFMDAVKGSKKSIQIERKGNFPLKSYSRYPFLLYLCFIINLKELSIHL